MYSVKYSTTTPTGSLRKGNAVMNITQDNDGPTSTTGFYNGIEVPEGGYLVILTKSGSSPAYFPCVGDTQLINLARNRIYIFVLFSFSCRRFCRKCTFMIIPSSFNFFHKKTG